LLYRGRNHKLLLSGHVGCGKSTLLNYLAEQPSIKESFFVVPLSIRDFVDPNEIDYIDLLLHMVLQTVGKAHASGYTIDPAAVCRIEHLTAQLHGAIVAEREKVLGKSGAAEVHVGVGLPAVLTWLTAGFKSMYRGEASTRKVVRETLRASLSELLDTINQLLASVRLQLGNREILILIDDTDKPPPELGLALFYDNGQHLARPEANIVFVVDTSVSCSAKYPIVKSRFGDERFFPAVQVEDRAGRVKPDRIEVLRELIRKRVPAEIIPDPELDQLSKLSGGLVRELVRLAREAVFLAHGRVEPKHVLGAAVEIRNSYNLMGEHVYIMEAVLKDPLWCHRPEAKAADQERLILDLLHMPALLQYRNGEDKWYRPYPVFIPWLEMLRRDRPA